MDLEELRAFIAVVESGSFLGAARRLGVSRTTLRRHVAALESRAGVPLVESIRNGVSPTPAGQLLARQGRTMMQEASALLASIREVGHEPSGTLQVVLPVGLPPHVLTPIFAAVRSAYPRLHVHCRFSNDPLNEALVDVDIAAHFGEDPPRGHWISHVVLRARQWLIASRTYLERRGTPRTVHDLHHHELFAWQAPGEDARVWRTLKGTSFTVEPSLIATDIHFLRSCCIAGLGIALVPDALLPDPGLDADALVPVLPDLVGQERPLRISAPAALADIPKIKVVLDSVRGMLGEL
ncbi:LysR family transcriptional regulator [Chondromyces apiculatus]|uniref:Transcriptional regulator, LysR family n=1 Tax=Chondromyces apiculatus DSM 436 TaxID=1192034 RepID=A0A017SU33_9BACT|nr:LysR family transcriptional regulator [Chondromyces apiculatus]EYF00469.1 Transcriptional regulator, LysR family [Chondromyces apiculatus DSM 436]